jgi:aspartate dehydrogenase
MTGKMKCPKCGNKQLRVEAEKRGRLGEIRIACEKCTWNSVYVSSRKEFLGVALVGCGAIGTILAQAIDAGKVEGTRLSCVYDLDVSKAENLVTLLVQKPIVASSYRDLLECEDVDLVVEAASQEAVRQYSVETLQADKDFMIMSVGALVDKQLLRTIRDLTAGGMRRVYIPSGAVGGLDALKAAAVGRIDEVVLKTRKPPAGLIGAPYLDEHGISLQGLDGVKTVYRGKAVDACRFFPTNVNVAATLSLAGIGPELTDVQIVADSTIKRNIHEISVKGEFGELTVRACNVTSPVNPKTSTLAILSAIATLRTIADGIRVGS